MRGMWTVQARPDAAEVTVANDQAIASCSSGSIVTAFGRELGHEILHTQGILFHTV